MANQFGAGLELIGVRAVIADLNKYITGARQIQVANEQIAASNLRLEQASRRAAETQLRSARSAIKAEADQLAFQLASQRVQFTDTGRARRTDTKLYTELLKQQEAAQVKAIKSTRTATNDLLAHERAVGRVTAAQLELDRSISRLDFAKFSLLKAGVFIAAVAAVAAVTAGFIAATKAAAGFQDQLALINNLTPLTTEATQRLGNEILNLSKAIPKSPTELGTAAYFILSSGFDNAREALELLTITSKAATASFGNTVEIARAVTGVVNAYGKENLSAAQATEVLFAAAKVGAAEFTDFATQLGRLTSIGATLGIDLVQLASAMAALTNTGLPAAQAATGLLGVLNQLFSPAEEAKKALLSVGSSIEELRANVREKGLIPALQEMLAAFGNNQQALEELFPEVRGLSASLKLLADDSTRYNKIQQEVLHSVGIVDEAFERSRRNVSQQAQLIKNQLNVALIELGNEVLPIVAAAFGGLLRIMSAIVPVVKTTFNVFIGPINNILAVMRNLVESVKNAVQAISAALRGDWKRAWQEAVDTVVSFAKSIAAAILATAGPAINLLLAVIEEGINRVRGPINDLIGLVNSLSPGKGLDIGKIGEQRLQIDFTGQINKILGIEELNKETDLAAQNVKKLTAQYKDQSLTATEAQKKIKDLSDEFRKGGEEAARAKPLIQGAFGQISQEFADFLKIDAVTAGAIQGLDAVQRAYERTNSASFEYTKALAAVANAFRENATVARDIALGIARSSLEASQRAASALFARPTREVANLELELARVTQAHRRLRPAIEDAISSYNRDADAHEAAADRIDEATRTAVDGIRDRIERLQDVRPGATQEDQIKQLERRLRSIRGSSPGEEAARESLQNRIEALRDAVDKARDAHDKNIDRLEKEARARERAGEAAAERERQAAGLAKNAAEAEQRKLEQFDAEEKAIANKIELYKGETEVLQKLVQAGDKTLISQQEQRYWTGILIEQINVASGYVRQLSDSLAKSLIPEVDDAGTSAEFLNTTLRILTDEGFRNKFFPAIDAAALKQAILTGEITKTIKPLQDFRGSIENIEDILSNPAERGLQHGGIVHRETTIRIAEFNRPEAVLPLTNPQRSREILAQLPPGLLSSITPNGGSGASPSINIVANGETLETLRAMVHREVDTAFGKAQSQSFRSGALLNSGLG